MNFEEIVQKRVNTETKTGLRSSTMVQDSDIRYSRGYCSSNSTALKVQTQGSTAKDFFRLEKPKAKKTKSVCADAAEPSEQDKKDKKDRQDKKRKFRKRKERSNTPATGNNTIDALKKRKRTEIVILVESRVITAIRRTTLQILASSQKTSVSLGNFRAGNW